MNLRLSVVTLGVVDLARARAFYEQGLGLTPSGAGDEHISLYRCGPAVLALYPRKALAEDAQLSEGEIGDPAVFDGVTLACNCVSRQEVDALMARALAAGARLRKPAQEVFWGGYSGYFEDPDGHLWEAVHAPFFALDAAGGLQLPE